MCILWFACVLLWFIMLCIAFGLRLGGVFRCVVMVVMLVMVEFVLLLVKLGFWLGV